MALRVKHEARYEASCFHYYGKSIPVRLFEELAAVGISPTDLWDEFNNDSEDEPVVLFPLNTKDK